jgi:hypothetical protein
VIEPNEELDSIEKDMNELRAVYELYFMGVEKLEPLTPRDALRARIRKVRDDKGMSNALKFRLQGLQARMISLQNYWGRVNREREAGTYFRDVQKAKKGQAEILKREAAKKARGKTALVQPGQPTEGEEMGDQMLREDGAHSAETAPLIPNRAAPARADGSFVGRPSAQSAEDLTEPKLRQIYQAYITAKKRCGERVDLRFEDMAATLKKQVPSLMKNTGAQAIEFKVVIKSGHAVLKAIPKKD